MDALQGRETGTVKAVRDLRVETAQQRHANFTLCKFFILNCVVFHDAICVFAQSLESLKEH